MEDADSDSEVSGDEVAFKGHAGAPRMDAYARPYVKGGGCLYIYTYAYAGLLNIGSFPLDQPKR